MDTPTKEIVSPGSNRLGRVLIRYETERDDGEMRKALFALCRVLDVEDHESGRGRVYDCASEKLFDPLREGEEIPEYRIEFAYDCAFPNPEWEARRVNSGKFGFAAFRKIVVRVPPAQISMQPRRTAIH